MRHQVQSLAEALHEDFKRGQREARLTAEQIAAEFEKSAEWVYAIMRGEIQVTVKTLRTWIELTGGCHTRGWITRELCGVQPDAEPVESVETVALPEAIRECSEVFSSVASSVLDESEGGRQITRGELRAALKEINEAQAALVRLQNAVIKRCEIPVSHRARTLAETANTR